MRRRTIWLAAGAAALLASTGAASVYLGRPPAAPAVAVKLPPAPPEAAPEQVHRLCAACHAYPPPDSFPRAAWRREIKQAYDFLRDSPLRGGYPPLESVALYYESRAPAELPSLARPAAGPRPVRWERRGLRPPQPPPYPGVTNVNLVHLSDPHKLDALVCDAWAGRVLALKPYEEPPVWKLLGQVKAPAHAEVVDLDGDGIPDLLVADLGIFFPSDALVGKVVWLRGRPDGTFTPITLLDGVGRVADVRAADFRGTGRKDLVVGVFGSRNTGAILLLENETTDWDRPKFVPRVLDDRHGTIHVPVADLNKDGRPDFVALISQEHETVVAFLNQGGDHFRKETIYTAPHPAYGSSGIELVDLNGDGALDVLYTNGDTLDPPYLLKPYHGVQWLENPGNGTFPWAHHPLAAMYGAMRAVAADVDGDGDLDVIAVSYLPAEEFPQRAGLEPDSVLLLEQVAPGRFVPHPLETGTCDHVTCAAGAWDGDGRVHLAVGNFSLTRAGAGADSVVLWKNLGGRGPR
jgi:hypothetical protein